MEFNKFVSASLVMGSLALVGCGDDRKEGDKVIEVPAATVNHEAPKTDAAVVVPAPAHDAVVVTPAPTSDTAVVTPPATTETPNANVTVEETHKTETTTTPAN
ncbi:MAG: hypothetical protein ACRYGR_08575 [Janthinobacterium lividum]